MRYLMKPYKFSPVMAPLDDNGWWQGVIEHPAVIPDKANIPLLIFGKLVANPELSEDNRSPRCTGANVESIYCLQLDYDSGVSISDFEKRFSAYRYYLYTSHSHGYKGHWDRFRVVMPLASSMPCDLLENRRVKDNLCWHFEGVDQCCFDRGHWQAVPAIRAPGAPYIHRKHDGKLWGGDEYWQTYRQWVDEDKALFERKAAMAREMAKEANVEQLVSDLEFDLREIPVGQGHRYAETKRLLAKYMHRGIGDAVLGVMCPWDDKKWQRQWPGLVRWASTIV